MIIFLQSGSLLCGADLVRVRQSCVTTYQHINMYTYSCRHSAYCVGLYAVGRIQNPD